ncbi:unnamed protein product [Candidula unifasciata]|uniref:Cilia- and flagella-associated protein 97 n=1 Tax=Candidula unifasciata TaxID=100452 RepID=A0A8S4A1Z4_9EUPU|nr:unnamed protein product [Candidula unifasciata]
MMDLDVEKSIDFDFFDESPQGEQEHVTQQVSALKPPLHPHSTKQLPKPDSAVNDNKHCDSSKGEGSSTESDSSRDNSPDRSSGSDSEDVIESSNTHKKNAVESRNSRSRSSSASSVGSSVSSNSSTDIEQTNRRDSSWSKSESSDVRNGKRSQSGSDDREKRPINPLAKPVKQQATFNKGRHRENAEDSLNMFSDSDSSRLKLSATYPKGNRFAEETSGNKDTKQAWDKVKGTKEKKKMSIFTEHSKTVRTDRPKTAVRRNDKQSNRNQRSRSRSDDDSNSDSDITDVSSIETPRNEIEDSRYKQKIEEGARMTSAGDGHPFKLQFKPVSHGHEKDSAVNYDYDPDKITGFDLKILMKAVGELEKQNRVQTNSRRVMFAPANLKSSEKSNYTFDRNQTRDIERENHRLLKEIIRQVSAGEQKRQFHRQSGTYRLTPSAVNRERDIQRIERENLAFLKRLQEVRPTKSICRDQQLRAYETTVFHGVPVAALHHISNGKRSRNDAVDSASTLGGGRAESATSISSIGSSVRCMGSGRSSRPTSAKSGFSSKRIDSRPAWTDRW